VYFCKKKKNELKKTHIWCFPYVYMIHYVIQLKNINMCIFKEYIRQICICN